MSIFLKFLLALLATWRVSHLLANEDGPSEVIFRIRQKFGQGFWGKLMDCFKCLSLWIAIPFAFFVANAWLEIAVTWLALSGGAILLENLIHEPLIIEDGETNELLRETPPLDDESE